MERLLEMMNAMEREILRCPHSAKLAQSATDVERIRSEGKVAVVHTVEGAHVLDGLVDNVDKLAKRGVAMMTLSHFYDNRVAEHTCGIPHHNILHRLCGYDFAWHHPEPLTAFGKAVIQRMTEQNMLIDITHCSPAARAAIYSQCKQSRPIVASHTGVYAINPDPYNLQDDEIRELATRRGLIGLIFMTYWLDACEPSLGLDALWRTIEHILRLTGSFDHIALGTDFDGFTDPPDDLADASQMPRVTEMLLRRGVPETDVLKILGGNAQRVLEEGWKRHSDSDPSISSSQP
jgi:membrane dipeptidase